ncbi:MAG: acylphosphatase [Proteobacteria bacterium]|nr:acylphosphatase [Pseudomonadota bacterium]
MATSPTYGVFPLYSSSGSVINTEEGVEIIIQGDSTALDQFKERLMGQPPALSDITDMRVETLPPPPPER